MIVALMAGRAGMVLTAAFATVPFRAAGGIVHTGGRITGGIGLSSSTTAAPHPERGDQQEG